MRELVSSLYYTVMLGFDSVHCDNAAFVEVAVWSVQPRETVTTTKMMLGLLSKCCLMEITVSLLRRKIVNLLKSKHSLIQNLTSSSTAFC